MCVLLALLFWSGSKAHGQDSRQLRLKLTNAIPTICFGSTLKVRAELINASDEKVAVDVKTIWYQTYFAYSRSGPIRTNPDGTATGHNTGGSKTLVGDAGPNYEGEYLVLRPGGSYKSDRAIKLSDDFFNHPGDYDMKVTYGQFQDKSVEGSPVLKGTVESNLLQFKVINCVNGKRHSRRPS
jgi:hypothetical protein